MSKESPEALALISEEELKFWLDKGPQALSQVVVGLETQTPNALVSLEDTDTKYTYDDFIASQLKTAYTSNVVNAIGLTHGTKVIQHIDRRSK